MSLHASLPLLTRTGAEMRALASSRDCLMSQWAMRATDVHAVRNAAVSLRRAHSQFAGKASYLLESWLKGEYARNH